MSTRVTIGAINLGTVRSCVSSNATFETRESGTLAGLVVRRLADVAVNQVFLLVTASAGGGCVTSGPAPEASHTLCCRMVRRLADETVE